MSQMNDIIVRPDLGCALYSSMLFPHPNTPNLDKTHTFSFVTNGVESLISIKPNVDAHRPTIKTYRVLLALFKTWEEAGKPNPLKPFKLSLRDIVKNMQLKYAGEVSKHIKKELERMHTTIINWKSSYRTKNILHKSVKNMQILSMYEYDEEVDKSNTQQKFEQKLTVQFHPKIAENLLNNFTLPINLEVFNQLTPELQVIYEKMNKILLNKNNKTKTIEYSDVRIISMISKNNKKLKYPSERKRLLTSIANKLNDLIMNDTRFVLFASVLLTQDKKSYKLRFSAVKTKQQYLVPAHNTSSALIEVIFNKLKNTFKKPIDDVLIRYIAKSYPSQLIDTAIADHEESIRSNNYGKGIKNHNAHLMMLLHIAVHDGGFKWLKKCGMDCNYRKENNAKQ